MPVIGIYVDEYATECSSQDREVREIKHYLKQISPDATVIFVEPKDLNKYHNLDCYLFDFGGFCYIDWSGSMREMISKDILQYVEMYPNTLFVPISQMTNRFFADIAHEELKKPCNNINYEFGYTIKDVMGKIHLWLFGTELDKDLEYFDEPLFCEDDE